MHTTVYCCVCKQELTGAVERTLAREGNFVVIISQETSDCNWIECKGCKNIICKRCYAVQPLYCCSVDRIIASERAADKAKSTQQLLDESGAALRRTNGNLHP